MVPLPPYARRIEYLESNGTQYIDTGVVPNSATTEIWLRTLLSYGSTAEILFGSRSEVNRNAYGAMYYPPEASVANKKVLRYDFGDASDATIVQNLIDNILPGWVDIEMSGNNISIAGDGRARTVTAHLATASNAFSIYVFAVNTGGTPTITQGHVVVSSMQIRVSGAPVRSFIPCRILGVGYLWDEVEGKFYGNSGTGDFVLGPDVREGVVPTPLNPFGVGRRQEEIRRVEYLESTGTQWIDTGLNADDGLGCDMSMAFPDASMNINYTFGVLKRTDGTPPYVRYHASFSSDSSSLFLYLGGGTVIAAGVAASPGTGDWHRFTYDPQAQTASVDDSSGSTSGLGTWDAGMDFPLFGRQDSNGTLGLSRIRIRYAKFYRNGILVQDFVPVAIGSTGYLLDRVSGRLFGNSGTGSFVLGPDIVPRLRVWGNGQTSSLFDISTPYPLAAGNQVTGTVNGDARNGILASDLHTVYDAGRDYVGEFIDMTPSGTDFVALRWFDRVAGSPLVGYCEIVQ